MTDTPGKAADEDQTARWEGRILAGKYRVDRVLGSGGMGVVVAARHLGLDDLVAIKILRPELVAVPAMVERFLREARAASKIKSAHVVRVTDVDTFEDGVPFIVMEHLEGHDFLDLRGAHGVFGVDEAVGYILEAGEAIVEAHDLGIVHRDLKPSNLFLHQLRDGSALVKVLDFGISKFEAPDQQVNTHTGQMMGSPQYMSPEQMLSTRNVDARTDVWSLGAMLYEFVTGQPPFDGDSTPRVCALVLHYDPIAPSSLRPDLPRELEAILLRCLEKDPDRRFASVRELLDALAPFAPPPVSERPPRSVRVVPSVAPPPVLETPLPKSGSARREEPLRRRRSSGARVAMVIAGLALVAGLLYVVKRERTSSSSSGGLGLSSSVLPITPAPSSSESEPTKRAINPSDLPDVEPSGHARRPMPWPPGMRPGKNTKPEPRGEPTSDPFGGKRN